jgi:putative nucleotidyltransferase with HDIG domain
MGKDPVKSSRLIRNVLQLAGTALAFKLASDFSARFSQPEGASFLFPPAGISLAAGAAFGIWGVAGVLLGVIASPWGMASQLPGLLLSCLANGASAAIPAWVLRRPVGGTGRRLRRAFFSGALLNNLLSAVIGTLGLVALGRLAPTSETMASTLFFWWVSDLAAAAVLGLPLLLALRPDLLLAAPDRERLRAWALAGRGVAECVGLVLISLVPVVILEHLGWAFPHWLSVLLVAPIGLAALRGGAGPALLVGSFASVSYLTALLVVRPEALGDIREVLAPAYTTVGFFTAFSLVGGWLAGRNLRLLERVRAQQAQLEEDFERTVLSLAAAIEAKDPTTEGHVQRVAQLSVLVGRKLGFDERRLRVLRYGAMLHDVGKIGVPEWVLNKPGELTPDEKELMEQHVDIGLRIIRDVEVLREVEPLIRYHQERWDGLRHGVRYPGYFGLSGEQIPLDARILAVVDAFDAITHDRPYRRGMPVEMAFEELRREAGYQFDPRIVGVLIEVVREGGWVAGSAPVPAFAAGATPRICTPAGVP